MPWRGAFLRQCYRESSARPSVGKPTGRGEVVSSQMTNARKPGNRLQRFSGRITWTRESSPWKILFSQPSISMGRCLKQYPFDFMEYDVTWVESNIFGAAGALGAEAIELINCLLRFGWASEELRFIVARLADWMANSFPPWAAYCPLM